MPDPASIVTGLAALKHAVDIAKALRQADQSLATAELKLKVVELLGEIVEAKTAMVEVQEIVRDKDSEVARLKDALRIKGEVVKAGDAIFLKDPDGKVRGDAMCLHCWTSQARLNPLVGFAGDRHRYVCHACKSCYDNMRVSRGNLPPEFRPEPAQS